MAQVQQDSSSDHGDSSTNVFVSSADNTSNSDASSQQDSGTIGTRDETSSQDENNDDDEFGPKRITRKWLLEFFKKDWKTYYRTFELNERLYLHYKGFSELRCMELFPELKCIYFEGNGLRKMTGMETNV